MRRGNEISRRAARCELNLRDDYMPLRARKLNCTPRARRLIVARD